MKIKNNITFLVVSIFSLILIFCLFEIKTEKSTLERKYEEWKSNLMKGDICYNLNKVECILVVTNVYGLKPKSIDFSENDHIYAQGNFITFMYEKDDGFRQTPTSIAPTNIDCDLQANTCKVESRFYVSNGPYHRDSNKFGVAEAYIETQKNTTTYKIVKEEYYEEKDNKKIKSIILEKLLFPEECGAQYIKIDLEDNNLYQEYNSECEISKISPPSQFTDIAY